MSEEDFFVSLLLMRDYIAACVHQLEVDNL